jgi:hypothetical protein
LKVLYLLIAAIDIPVGQNLHQKRLTLNEATMMRMTNVAANGKAKPVL